MKAPAPSPWLVALNALSILGVMAIMALLIGIMYYHTGPGPVDQARWNERKRNLAEVNAQNEEQLRTYGWIDQGRGLVRLPITRAMELTVTEWSPAAAGRAGLLARVEKAIPPAPAPSTVKSNLPPKK